MGEYQPEDRITWEWAISDRVYELRASTFTKRQLRAHERTWNPRTEDFEQYAFNKERLENEKDALIFIARQTTIPVPRFINWSVDDDGVASLTMEKLEGRMMDGLMNDRFEDDMLTDEEKVALFQRDVKLIRTD
ncbi:MAG: hypothetical protein Q9170_006573 [Blastenia crenularia]